ncbi:MAG: hypothetical protein ACRDCH_02690 [Metamycoplasmataceae bacterium]
MKKSIKKMALGIMTTGTLVVPLTIVASCGSSVADKVDDFEIEPKQNPKVWTVDIEGNKYKEYKTLSKVFEGLDTKSFDNVVASLQKDASGRSDKNVIILTAKSGYTIKGEKSISSVDFIPKPPALEITPIPKTPADITGSELFDVNNIDLLQKLFEGIEYDDLENIETRLNKITYRNVNNNSNSTEYTITLIAKGEFYFVDSEDKDNKIKELTSGIFSVQDIPLNITIKDKPKILKSDIENDNYKSLKTLQKLFDGLNEQNWNNVQVEISDSIIDFNKAYLVTLIAADGYKINGRYTLVSEEFILPRLLDISPQAVVPNDITHLDLKNLEGNDENKKLTLLSKIFQGIKGVDLTDLDIEITNLLDNTNTIRVNGSYTITLKVKTESNVVFLDEDSKEVKQITSKVITIVPVPYQMSIIERPTIYAIDILNNKYKELTTLEKLFNGITQEILNNLQVEITGTIIRGVKTHRVVLLANNGFLINGSRTLVSDDFTLDDTILNVEAKTEDIILSKNDVEGSQYKELPTLKKLFNIPNDEDFDKFDVTVNNEDFTGNGTTHIITLTARDAFTFATGKTITKSFNLETVLAVTPKTGNITLSMSDVDNNNHLSNETLKKLFDNLKDEDFDHFTSKIDVEVFGSGTTHEITLTAKTNFTFASGKVITKAFNLETVLNVNAKTEDIILSKNEVEGNKYKELSTLKKLFNIPNDEDFDKFEVRVDNSDFTGSGTTHEITLTARDAFTFATGKTITKSFNLETVLAVTKVESDPKNITHLDLEGLGYKSLDVLSRLFIGINASDIDLIDVSITDLPDNGVFAFNKEYKITITAPNGYIFRDTLGNQTDSLVSVAFKTVAVIWDISRLPSPTIENKDIEELNNANGIINDKIFTILGKLFSGSDFNKNNLQDVSFFLNPPTDTEEYYTVDLNFENWIQISSTGNNIIYSTEFTLKTIITDVVIKDNITDVSITQVELDKILNKNDADINGKRTILLKLFTGISINNFDLFKISEIKNNNETQIVLEALDDYVFIENGSEVPFITSKSFKITEILTGKAKAENIFLNLSDVDGGNHSSFTTLQKLFDNLDNADLNTNFEIIINSQNFVDGATYWITLKANNGFIFGDGREISKEFTLNTKLSITAKDHSGYFNDTQIDETKITTKDVTALALLFNGIEINKIASASWSEVSGEFQVILTAEVGYVFMNGKNTLEAKPFKYNTKLNVIFEDHSGYFNDTDITEAKITNKDATALALLFNGIEINKISSATLALERGFFKVTLTAEVGYVFTDGGNTLESKVFKYLITTSSVILHPATFTHEQINKNAVQTMNETALKLLFDNFNKTGINEATLILDGDFYKVTLVAKAGYIFDNHRFTLDSNPFNIILEIVAKDIIMLNNSQIDAIKNLEENALKLLFNNINSEVIQHIQSAEISQDDVSGQSKITLTLKKGFVFVGNQEKLESKPFNTV